MSFADGTPDVRIVDEPDDPDHTRCDCCQREICLRGPACFSVACSDRPGRRVQDVAPPAEGSALCETCAGEWEAEERGLQAMARALDVVAPRTGKADR